MRSARVARNALERRRLLDLLDDALDELEGRDNSLVHYVARRADDGDEASLWEWSFFASGWSSGYRSGKRTGERVATSNTPAGRVARGKAKSRKKAKR